MGLQVVKNFFSSLFNIELHDRIKLFCLSLAFFLVIGGYTVTRTLKDSLFTSIVGLEWIYWAKWWSIILLVPSLMVFSKLVDSIKRHQLIYVYSLLYCLGGLIIAFFLSHPTIGLPNTTANGSRIFGWIIYFFLEGYNPFLVSLLWSFSHSITTPEQAKVNYPLMVGASKFGGMITTTIACWFLTRTDIHGALLLSDAASHQMLLILSSVPLLFVPFVIKYLMQAVPRKHLHGYEAAYRIEKKHEHEEKFEEKKHTNKGLFSGSFSGLWLMLQYPYVMGIFGVIFFWEIINVFINFERLSVGSESMAEKTAYLLNQDFWAHAVGLVITIIGTRTLIKLLGERKSLILVPIAMGVLLGYYFTAKSATVLAVVFILIRSINYAFAAPLRESLYVPTTKEIKFKSKAWIDAFGVKIAKSVGAGYAGFLASLPIALHFTAAISFFSCVIGLWVLTAHFLGKRFEKCVQNNEAIGPR